MCTCCKSQARDNAQEALEKAFQRYAGTDGALIPLLQEAQEIYGYLPREVMREIAQRLKIPFSQVYGVATFYAQFHLKPRGRNIIRVCQGTACHVRGASRILDAVSAFTGIEKNQTTADLRFTLETVACLGSCSLAPVMMVNDETYGRLKPKEVATILERYV